MMVKTKRRMSHLDDLEETFSSLARFNLKLNPCTFGVKFIKFLGFMMSERRIEANLEKLDAIALLIEPRCIKDVQHMNGCMAALGRFVSKSAEKYLPFFKALKSSKNGFEWTPECSLVWKNLKSHI